MSRELGKDHRRESRRRGLSPGQEQLPALMYTRRSSPESQYSVNHDDNVEGITLQARLANKGRKRAEILKEIERLGLTEEITLPPLGIATPATSLPPTSKEEPPASLHADIVGDAQGGRRKLRKKRGLPSLLEPKPEEPSKKEFLNSPPNQSLGSKARGAFQKFRGTLSPPSRPSIRARTYPAVVDTQKKIELAREARRNLVEPSKYYEASPRSFGLKSTSSKETSTPADLERKIELARKLPRAKAPGDFLDTTSNALSRSFERDELSHPEIDMRFDTQNKVELAREAQWNLAYGTLPDEYSVNEILWGEIDSFTERGIKSASGEDHEFDTIICATGFNMSFSPRFPIIGENGVDLQKKWDKNPECYLSVTAANMPNYFMYLGPGSPLGHGSVVSSLERVTEYMRRMITKLQTENYSSVVPKPHIPRAYQKQALAWLEKTAWSSNCVSTYKMGILMVHSFLYTLAQGCTSSNF
jgi:hypothetical protein